jgi:hypothetical protein
VAPQGITVDLQEVLNALSHPSRRRWVCFALSRAWCKDVIGRLESYQSDFEQVDLAPKTSSIASGSVIDISDGPVWNVKFQQLNSKDMQSQKGSPTRT